MREKKVTPLAEMCQIGLSMRYTLAIGRKPHLGGDAMSTPSTSPRATSTPSIAFYSTPTGKKTLAEMPAITQEAMQASSGVMQTYMEHAMQEVQDQIAQMLKEAQPDPKKATSTN
jgi:Uncharacterized protein conserved in bacteria (DUF2059)